MILAYIQLVGSTSAKDIFNQCVGTYLKQEELAKGSLEVHQETLNLKAPTDLRRKVTHIIQEELDILQRDGMIERSCNGLGQVFYRVKV